MIPAHKRAEHEAIRQFKKKWGIEKEILLINGMQFDIDFRQERDGRITAWITTEEGIPGEDVVLWLMQLGLLNKEPEGLQVEWK